MPVPSMIRDVFDHFQNLNLLALVQDLRDGHTTGQAWFSGALLCPVAHGLGTAGQVQRLAGLFQAPDIERDCRYAADQLGATQRAVIRFVTAWDEGRVSSYWLQRQLEELWAERLADADCMQELLHPPGSQRTAAAGQRDQELVLI